MKSFDLTLALAGQCLIKRRLEGEAIPGFSQVVTKVRAADLAFTNFEGAIRGRHGGELTKDSYFSAVSPVVLDDLRSAGFDLLSLSNNHAYDFGPGGVLSTVEEATGRGFTVAGAGSSLDSAERPAFVQEQAVRVGLLAMDLGPQDDKVYACNATVGTVAKPGINPLRIDIGAGGSRRPKPEDGARIRELVQRSSSECDLLLVYGHSHHWEKPMWNTPDLSVSLAHDWIDNGAGVVVFHGTPAFQGIEIYRGSPIFYGLGNFVFHSWKPERWAAEVGLRPWQGILASCRWSSGGLNNVRIEPLALGHDREDAGATPGEFHDLPVVPQAQYGTRILETLASLCAPFGSEVRLQSGYAEIALR